MILSLTNHVYYMLIIQGVINHFAIPVILNQTQSF